MAVIIDHTNRRVLEVLENREQKTVTEFLQKAHQSGLLKQVTEVTTDMWDAYVNAAKAAFGENVSVVVDRFQLGGRLLLTPFDVLIVPAFECFLRHLEKRGGILYIAVSNELCGTFEESFRRVCSRSDSGARGSEHLLASRAVILEDSDA